MGVGSRSVQDISLRCLELHRDVLLYSDGLVLLSIIFTSFRGHLPVDVDPRGRELMRVLRVRGRKATYLGECGDPVLELSPLTISTNGGLTRRCRAPCIEDHRPLEDEQPWRPGTDHQERHVKSPRWCTNLRGSWHGF